MRTPEEMIFDLVHSCTRHPLATQHEARIIADAARAEGYAQGRADMAEEAARVVEHAAEESKPYIGRRSHLRMQGTAATIRALAKEPAK